MDMIITRENPVGNPKTTDLIYAINKILDSESPTMLEELNAIEEAIEAKVGGAAAVIKKAEAFEEVIALRIKELTELKRSYASRQERLKSYIKFAMGAAKIKKIEGPTVAITYSVREDGKLSIIDESSPSLDKYRVKSEVWSLDKDAIEKDLKSGAAIDGAKMVPVETLRIKGE